MRLVPLDNKAFCFYSNYRLSVKVYTIIIVFEFEDFRKEATAYSLNSTSNDRGEIILSIMVTWGLPLEM